MASDSGSATLLATNEYIQVTHTIGATPVAVVITAQQDGGGHRFWVPVAHVTSTYFRIYIESIDPFSDYVFYWYAED